MRRPDGVAVVDAGHCDVNVPGLITGGDTKNELKHDYYFRTNNK